LEQQCKVQELVSRPAVLADSSIIGDHVVTGCNQVVSTEGWVAVGEQPAPSDRRASLHKAAHNKDEAFLRDWLSTFQPVEEKQFKQGLHQCRIEMEDNMQIEMKRFKQEVQATVAGFLDLSVQADAAAVSCKQEGTVELERARLEALQQNIRCLLVMDCEPARSSLLQKFADKEADLKASLAKLNQNLQEFEREVSDEPLEPLELPDCSASEGTRRYLSRIGADVARLGADVTSALRRSSTAKKTELKRVDSVYSIHSQVSAGGSKSLTKSLTLHSMLGPQES